MTALVFNKQSVAARVYFINLFADPSPCVRDPNDPANYTGKTLSDDQKLELLTVKFSFPHGFKFPTTAGRRFQLSWMEKRPWLRYSIRNDTAHCIYCICFSNNTVPNESPFISKGFKNWKKAGDERLDTHARSEEHQLSEEKMTNFLKTRRPGNDISARLQRQAAEQQHRTMKGVVSITDVVIALGQRGIPLRGNWDPSKRNEDGNFSFFVDWKSKYDPELKDHLDHASGNAKYTSPRIQNEIINLCDSFIRNRVRASIPKYWSVMADETQDCSTTEQLSICVRYLSSKNEVCEEFIGFVRLEKLDAQTIAHTLLHALQEWGFNMSGLVGQGYDGASVTSSSRNGVQAKVAEKYPNATYVHCRSHVLNLAISSGCKAVRSIQNLFDNVSKLTWFLSGSAKRKEIFLQTAAASDDSELLSALVACADEDEEDESAKTLEEGSKRQTVPKFCATRWSAKVTTLSALLANYGSVLLALDEISSSSSGDAKRDASAYSRLLQDSEFIVALTVSQFVLSFLAQVTKSLQAKSCNLGDAYQSVTLAKECIKSARGDESWQKVWSRISQVADSINVTLIKPRTTTVQRHRANAAHNDQPSDYYRINVFYPFIDHVVGELETRFSVQHEGLITAQNLFPLYLPKLTDRHIEKIKNYFSKHLDFSEKSNFDAELARWRMKHAMEPESEQEGAMPDCSPQEFPAIHKVLSIFLTTPVGSVSCERSFSALRRLKLWTRSSITEGRLSGLAMLLIHRGTDFIPTPKEIYDMKSNW